jgi:hypothetical protein
LVDIAFSRRKSFTNNLGSLRRARIRKYRKFMASVTRPHVGETYDGLMTQISEFLVLDAEYTHLDGEEHQPPKVISSSIIIQKIDIEKERLLAAASENDLFGCEEHHNHTVQQKRRTFDIGMIGILFWGAQLVGVETWKDI